LVNSLVHCHRFPSFERTENCLPLFLVVCQSIPTSTRFTERLYDWTRSADGINTYQTLLTTHRDALPPDELMLSLSALSLLQNISSTTEADDMASSEPILLTDFDRLLNGHRTIQSGHAVLRDTVWSFFRAILYSLSQDDRPHYTRFLDSTLAAVSTSKENPDRILDHYWMKRLRSPMSHADAVAQVWDDAQSLRACGRSSTKHTETEERFSDLIDGKAGNETSNYSIKSTRVGNMPLGKHTKDEYSVYNRKRHASFSWWSTILGALGLGSCGGRSG